MIILHNPHDQTSRLFIEQHPLATVINWYDETARNVWLGNGGTQIVAAFPCVVVNNNAIVVTQENWLQWDSVELIEGGVTP